MAFNIPSQWGYSKKAPVSALKTWTRPADWIAITDTPNEVQFLVSDAEFLSYTLKINTTGPGNLYVDWGDGVTDTVTYSASDQWVTHTYTLGGGTPCSRGYTTWKVRVYTDVGTSITGCIFDTQGSTAIPYVANILATTCGVLEIYYGDGVAIPSYASLLQTTSRGMYFNLLEYFKFPSDCSSVITTSSFFSSTFGITIGDATSNLAKVVLPVNMGTSYNLNFDTTFRNCYNLLEVTFPQTCKLGDLTSAFSGCSSLQSVTFPTYSIAFDTCTSLNTVFNNCRLLNTINNFPTNLPACTNLGSAFANCSSLTSILIPTLPTGTITMGGIFSGCNQLRSVTFAGWNSGTIWGAGTIFQNCTALEGITFPANSDFTTLASAFTGCYSLKSVIFSSACPNLTTLALAFQNCTTLNQISLPSSVSVSGILLQTTFSGCSALESITIPSGWNITGMPSTFTSCTALKSISLPTSMASCTSFASTFQSCTSLKTVSFPASMPALTTLSSTFSGCSSLLSVVLPTSMAAVTTIDNLFNACRSLTDVNFPSSMPVLANFQNAFVNCNSIRTITLPATISASPTSFSAFASGCYALTTLTLPTTQTTGLPAAGALNLAYRCGNLKTINNLDKLGSNSTTGTILTTFGSGGALYANYSLTSVSFSCRLSVFSTNNVTVLPAYMKISSVRFLNTGSGQWTGANPQVDIQYSSLATPQIVQMFNDLAAQGIVTAKTINITGAIGAAGLTAADRLIVTSKGWTIVG